MAAKGDKFEPRKDEYLRLLSEKGYGRTQAARAVKVSRTTLSEYRKEHPAFADEEVRAEMDWEQSQIVIVEDALFKAATEDRNVTAIQVYLYNRAPDRWKDRRAVHHSGHVGMSFDEAKKELQDNAEILKRHGVIQFPSGNGKSNGHDSRAS